MFYWYFWAFSNYVPLLCICCLCSSWQILFRLSALFLTDALRNCSRGFGVKLRKFYYAFDFAAKQKNYFKLFAFFGTRKQLLTTNANFVKTTLDTEGYMLSECKWFAVRFELNWSYRFNRLRILYSSGFLNWISIIWPSNSCELGFIQFHQYHNILYQLIHNCRSISCWLTISRYSKPLLLCSDKYIYINNTIREPEYEIAHMFSGVL